MNKKELERFEKQQLVDVSKTLNERKQLGQFSTPYSLAEEIADYGLKHLDKEADISFLDPALGSGVFFSALMAQSSGYRLKRMLGYELDPDYGEIARKLWGSRLEVRIGDFLVAKPDRQVNLLLANPPYVRHHFLPVDYKNKLLAQIQRETAVPLSGYASLYSHFILLAHKWLKPHAICGWLIPSEFMDVNYGQELKKYLLNHVKLLRIHRYDPNALQFKDALVSSSVLWYENTVCRQDYDVELSFGGTHDHPDISRKIPKSVLEKEPKWTKLTHHPKPASEASLDRIEDFFDIKRGCATGDNAFFIMDQQKIQKNGLSMDYMHPILPSPRFLGTDVIEANPDGSPVMEKPYYLINCTLLEEDLQKLYPELWNYLQKGIDTVSNRYLCKNRKRWYFQERRASPPILCTYMGRKKTAESKPFHFIRNYSNAIATNSYLMLYPKGDLLSAMGKDPKLLDNVWLYLNRLSTDIIEQEGRVYGGGLKKIEPRELGKVPCPGVRELIEQAQKNSF